jgi:pyruvate,water dikinase
MEELSEFDPAEHLARLRRSFDELHPDVQERVRSAGFAEFQSMAGAESLQEDMGRFLDRFGHLSDSGNDFSCVPWRENPDVVLRLVTDQIPTENKAMTRRSFSELPLSRLRRFMLWPLYRQARRFRWYREAVSSLYTYGYGLFRPYFLALGQQFRSRGLLDAPTDILYLGLDEVRAAVHDSTVGGDYCHRVAERQAAMEEARNVEPPPIIFGEEALPMETDFSGTLQGVPTSRGHYTGPVKTVQGLEDFAKLAEGDVLVVPYSDVGWTPLFARAGAVVAESGGLLSHSSIVAREFGIPAVVSVPGACSLEDNTVVTVDGFRGEIRVHDTLSQPSVTGELAVPIGSMQQTAGEIRRIGR